MSVFVWRLMGKDNDKFSTSHCKIQIQQHWPRLTRTGKENKSGEKLSLNVQTTRAGSLVFIGTNIVTF